MRMKLETLLTTQVAADRRSHAWHITSKQEITSSGTPKRD
jgi:hypothetical protein